MRGLLRFTLDLFDPAPPEAPDSASKATLALTEYKQSAIELKASEALIEAARGSIQPPAPVTFRHPRANREARFGSALVAYEFRRGKRRSIGFSVGSEGLVVSAPRWVPIAEVQAALHEKSAWVLQKLEQARQHQKRLESNRIEWRDGATLPFLGGSVVVVLDPRHAFKGAGAVLHADAHSDVAALHVGLPSGATPAQIRDAVQAWLMRQARRLFTERLNHFAPRLNVQWRRLALSSAGTRWGSAGPDGSIRLNWRLVHFRLPVIDYVVAHELSHLRVMNHSPLFWDTVRTVVPDYAELRGQLKDEALPRWD
ncbi:MAG TPA: SprT family zinc-dependent metalloprotease [Rhodoferax sp.]|nr:SprT family zinc-dependent metalloprotease [Rhodoferax sp.]